MSVRDMMKLVKGKKQIELERADLEKQMEATLQLLIEAISMLPEKYKKKLLVDVITNM